MDNTDIITKFDAPYVGLRPFTKDERQLFFGRDNEAKRLRNKIISNRLTLLYAPSGVGKTSLLLTRVIPSLEEADMSVVYFNRWGENAAYESLINEVRNAAEGTFVREKEELIDVVRYLYEASNQPVVLILDQFEAFLTYQPGAYERLGSQLAALAQAEFEAYVVLSLREEFIGTLHALRSYLPSLLSSTFRLEHFNLSQAREAIHGPLQIEPFHRLYNENQVIELVNVLFPDLQNKPDPQNQALTPPPRDSIDLPLLQLIFRELWDKANSPAYQSYGLTLNLYRNLGGSTDAIIQSYFQPIFDSLESSRNQEDAAEILRYLAPVSGAKKSCTVKELEENTGLPGVRIANILNHLSNDKKKVIRRFETTAGSSYELVHDRLIRLIRPWIEVQLRKRKERAVRNKLLMWIVTVLFVLVFIGVSWLLLRNQQLDRAEIARNQAFTQAINQNFPEALILLEKSLSIYTSQGDDQKSASTHVDIGKIYTLRKEYDQAEKSYRQAIDIAKKIKSSGIEGLAFEGLGSLYEQRGDTDSAFEFYEQAQQLYSAAAEIMASARLLEWFATYEEKRDEYDHATKLYKRAQEGYAIVGDPLGIARVNTALTRTIPWGFLVNLKTTERYSMRGGRITLGRDSPNAKVDNDISFTNRLISRRHLVINHDKFQMDDLRSRNGTAVNGKLVPYGLGVELTNGDIISLANTEILQFRTDDSPPPNPPASAWAIFINEKDKSYRYLTDAEYFLSITEGNLNLGTEVPSGTTLLKLRYDGLKAEMYEIEDDWNFRFIMKENDYDYREYQLPQAQWIDLIDLPASYIRSSEAVNGGFEGTFHFQVIMIRDVKH